LAFACHGKIKKGRRLSAEVTLVTSLAVLCYTPVVFINKKIEMVLTIVYLAAGLVCFRLFYKATDWFENI